MMPAVSRVAGFPRRGRGASCFLLLLWLTAPAFAVDVRSDLWVTNGPVHALAVDSAARRIYVGGEFTEVGPADPLTARIARNRLAAFDLDSGEVTSWDPSAEGAVYALWLSAETRQRWDFTANVDGWTGGGDATVEQSDGSLILTVTEQSEDPRAQRGLAGAERFLGSDAHIVRARVRRTGGTGSWEGRVYYGTGGHGRSASYYKSIASPSDPGEWNIVEWDMSALTAGGDDWMKSVITAIDIDLSGDVGDVWQVDWVTIGTKTLYVGGDFTGIGGQERNRLAALDIVIGQPRAWNQAMDLVGADGAVRAMIPSASGNTLYIAGSFGTVANASRRGLAEVGMLGNSGITGLGQTALFEAGADLRALALGANRLYVGGTFVVADTDQDDEPQRLAAVDLSTFRLAANWMPAIDDGEVRSLHHLPDQNVVYAGGSFTGIGGSPRAGVAAFNAQNGELLTWNPQLAGAVDTLARSLDRTVLYLGGQFNAVAGVLRTNLAAVSTINAAVLGDWEVAADGGVFSFATAEDAAEESYVLYAGGAFTAIDASPRSGLAALTALAPEREPPLTVANPPGRFFNSNDVATAGQNCNDDDIPLPPGQPDCGGVDLPVALLCDDGEGAGCAATYYTLDGSEPDADSPRYVAPISIRVDTVLKFFSVDHAGNAGAVSSEVYTFETDPPRTSVDPPSRVFEEGRLEIRLSCTDTGSGCAATYYTLDGSRPTVNSLRYTGPIVITGDAVLQYFSVDVAGNAEGVRRSDYVDNRGEVGAFGLELLLMLPAAAMAASRRKRREHG